MASTPSFAVIALLSDFPTSALLDHYNLHFPFKQSLKDLLFDKASRSVPSPGNMGLLWTHFKNLQAEVSPSRVRSDMESVFEITDSEAFFAAEPASHSSSILFSDWRETPQPSASAPLNPLAPVFTFVTPGIQALANGKAGVRSSSRTKRPSANTSPRHPSMELDNGSSCCTDDEEFRCVKNILHSLTALVTTLCAQVMALKTELATTSD